MRARRLVRRLSCLLAGTTLTAGTLLSVVPAPAANATSWTASSYAARILYDMNVARAQHGLPALHSVYGEWRISGWWSNQMAARHVLSHDPKLVSLTTSFCPHWTTLGENVGYGASNSPDTLFKAYWNSAGHRANILNRSYRYVGVTAVFTGSTAWNTVDFVNAC